MSKQIAGESKTLLMKKIQLVRRVGPKMRVRIGVKFHQNYNINEVLVWQRNERSPGCLLNTSDSLRLIQANSSGSATWNKHLKGTEMG